MKTRTIAIAMTILILGLTATALAPTASAGVCTWYTNGSVKCTAAGHEACLDGTCVETQKLEICYGC